MIRRYLESILSMSAPDARGLGVASREVLYDAELMRIKLCAQSALKALGNGSDMARLISIVVNEYPEDDDRRIIAESIAKKYDINTSEM